MSDHSALHFNSADSASPKIERMKNFLSLYDIKYSFIAGEKNVVADGLSRCTADEGSFMDSNQVDGVAQSIEDIGFCYLSAETSRHEGMLAYYHGGRGHWKLKTTLDMIVHPLMNSVRVIILYIITQGPTGTTYDPCWDPIAWMLYNDPGRAAGGIDRVNMVINM